VAIKGNEGNIEQESRELKNASKILVLNFKIRDKAAS
jgi:hypothetical protein